MVQPPPPKEWSCRGRPVSRPPPCPRWWLGALRVGRTRRGGQGCRPMASTSIIARTGNPVRFLIGWWRLFSRRRGDRYTRTPPWLPSQPGDMGRQFRASRITEAWAPRPADIPNLLVFPKWYPKVSPLTGGWQDGILALTQARKARNARVGWPEGRGEKSAPVQRDRKGCQPSWTLFHERGIREIPQRHPFLHEGRGAGRWHPGRASSPDPGG